MNETKKINAHNIFMKGVNAYHDNDFGDALSYFEEAEKLGYPIDQIDSYRKEIRTQKKKDLHNPPSNYNAKGYSSTLLITNLTFIAIGLILSFRWFVVDRRSESMLAFIGAILGVIKLYLGFKNKNITPIFDIIIAILIIIITAILYFASRDTVI